MPQLDMPEAAGSLSLYLLGSFRVMVGKRLIQEQEWRLRKALSLVKLLALAPAFRLHREQVLEQLWPALEPEAALNNLHRTLFAARRILEPELRGRKASSYLSFQGDMLCLSLAASPWTDVAAFEAAAIHAQKTGEFEDYEAALALYTGDLLPDDLYEDWAAGPRSFLRQRYLALLAECARRQCERRAYRQAVQTWQRLLVVEPGLEEAHVELMRLYARTGQRYQALRQYQQLQATLRRELDVEPTAATQKLYRDIRSGLFPSAQERLADLAPALALQDRQEKSQLVGPSQSAEKGTQRTNLPRSLTGFVGRVQEMAELHRLLATTPLLTLVGAGGCGKTRLALQLAATLFDEYPDGVFLISLAALDDPLLVPTAVIEALGLDLRALAQETPLVFLQRSLQGKRVLLLLDNCEHLREACAQLAEALVSTSPHLRILATSRQGLGVAGEQTWRVPSLSVPDPAHLPPFEQLLEFDAVRLFLQQATASRSAFALTPANTLAVIELCRQLDGIPLAIELAAAWIKVLSPEQIAGRLDDALALLVGGNASALPRQRTLRATLDWSYALLGEKEQNLLRLLAIFADTWTIEGAEGICADHGIAREEVLEVLAQLVDKSLVQVKEYGDHMRYRFLETLRQYGAEKLAGADELAGSRKRHALWYLALVEEMKSAWEGVEQAKLLKKVQEEYANLRAALRWTVETGELETGLRLGAALWRFWQLRGYLSEGRRWLEEIFAQTRDVLPVLRAPVLLGAGTLALDQGDYQQAKAWFEEGLRLHRAAHDTHGIMLALNNLGIAVEATGDYVRAKELYQESLALARLQNNTGLLARALNNLGVALYREGDYAQAVALYEESLLLVRASGNKANIVIALNNLAEAACRAKDYPRARARYREGLPIAQALGYQTAIAFYLGGLAEVAVGLEQLPRAVQLWGMEEALRLTIGVPLEPDDQEIYHRRVAMVRAQLDAAEFTQLWERGRALSVERAVEYALTDDEIAEAPSARPESGKPEDGLDREVLSQREREVAALIAIGDSNRTIATKLTISERTVENHVGKILARLQLSSRAQIAVWVVRHQQHT